MPKSKCYEVTLTATATRIYYVAGYDEEEAVDKAVDLFGDGTLEDYQFDGVTLENVINNETD